MPTSLKTLTTVTHFTMSLAFSSIISCQELSTHRTLFDQIHKNFEELHDASAHLTGSERDQFNQTLVSQLDACLHIGDELDDNDATNAIRLLAFCTVFRVAASDSRYNHYFRQNYNSLLDTLYAIFQYCREKPAPELKADALTGLACFCYIMHKYSTLWYLPNRVDYLTFFHHESNFNTLVNDLLTFMKKNPSLSHYIKTALKEITSMYVSLNHLTFSKEDKRQREICEEDKVYFSDLVNDIKAFIKNETTHFIQASLQSIKTATEFKTFSTVYTQLSQLTYRYTMGRAALQQHLTEKLLDQLTDTNQRDAMRSIVYDVLDKDFSWWHIAANTATQMQPVVRQTVLSSEGYRDFMLETMQTVANPPSFFNPASHAMSPTDLTARQSARSELNIF